MNKRKHSYFTTTDLIYLCSMYENTNKQDLALALDREYRTILTTACRLKREGLFDYYKNLGRVM